jgi:hypothetical protein
MTDAEFAAAYPMHAKVDKVKVERQAIGEFIEHGGYVLCEYKMNGIDLRTVRMSINQVLAKYFEIDMKLLEAEKQAMLKTLAEQPI